MKEKLQKCIYMEKYLSYLYRKAASLSPMCDERDVLLNFAKGDAKAQAELNKYFYELYQEFYDPFIAEIQIHGTFRDVLNHILQLEIESYLDCRRLTYGQSHYLLQETMRAIADMKLGHNATILAIIEDMNETNRP